MADGRRFALNPQLDIPQILLEAKNRWLRPSEICAILRNFHRFHLTPDPPFQPPGGSLYLFDRKVLRYFRKDGHLWRKKKDGKTVREAHEKLKSGSVDVLHCYYAHGEDNESFQRRSYWLLDEQLEHIVLVHYRDVNEGSRASTSPLTNLESTKVNQRRDPTNSGVCFKTSNPGAYAAQPSYLSSPTTTEWNGQTPSSQLEDADSGDDVSGASLADSTSSGFHFTPLAGNNIAENIVSGRSDSVPLSYSHMGGSSISFCPYYENQVLLQNLIVSEEQENGYRTSRGTGSFVETHFSSPSPVPTSTDILNLNRKHIQMQDRHVSLQPSCSDHMTTMITDSLVGARGLVEFGVDSGYKLLADVHPQKLVGSDKTLFQEYHFTVAPQCQSNSESEVNIDQPLESENEVSHPSKCQTHDNSFGELKKLDSFGRWMNKEIGKDCDDSLMVSDSCTYWNTLDTGDDKEVSSLSPHMQLDIDSLGPSLSQEQLFSILDFSPEWAFVGMETKILISGSFLGATDPYRRKWCCMFGEHEVSAEVLTSTVLRCIAPVHAPGRVPFYITCSNRLACSEVREFEFRECLDPSTSLSPQNGKEDELCLQRRFAMSLSLTADMRRRVCSIDNCCKCNVAKSFFSTLKNDGNEWSKMEKNSKSFRHSSETFKEAFIQELLEDKLYQWVSVKTHEEGKGPNVLDKEGQGVIHLAAALGYAWAISPIVAAGVPPNFRDAHGRTALHWAAHFGREETVVELIRLGASPGAVDDPTPICPGGQKAADLASSRGHKGIAGYLAEADLTSYLSSLSLKGSCSSSSPATLAAEKESATKTVQDQNSVLLAGDQADQMALRGSLAAVRNSAQAAAQIQATFRYNSFRRRQLTKDPDAHSDIPDEVIVLSSLKHKARKTGHFSKSLNTAAIKIQQKYRAWKGRKEFLKIRDRIVKIQAHVRGHQVRKQYKKVIWSVSIVEKAILRWRRKGAGLRGFRAERAFGAVEQGVGKTDEYDFLRAGRKQKVAGVEKALARVQSMVRYPEARDQYMRLVASSQKPQLGDFGSSSSPIQASEPERKVAEEDPLALMT